MSSAAHEVFDRPMPSRAYQSHSYFSLRRYHPFPDHSSEMMNSQRSFQASKLRSTILNSMEGSRSEFGIGDYSADEGIAAVAVLVRMIAM